MLWTGSYLGPRLAMCALLGSDADVATFLRGLVAARVDHVVHNSEPAWGVGSERPASVLYRCCYLLRQGAAAVHIVCRSCSCVHVCAALLHLVELGLHLQQPAISSVPMGFQCDMGTPTLPFSLITGGTVSMLDHKDAHASSVRSSSMTL
eukprot:scaffold1903_cov396-Prasinococcus_capsulatus_cf.AAC.21